MSDDEDDERYCPEWWKACHWALIPCIHSGTTVCDVCWGEGIDDPQAWNEYGEHTAGYYNDVMDQIERLMWDRQQQAAQEQEPAAWHQRGDIPF